MKDTYYFSHDYNARNDPKLINIQIKHGMQGIGVYWCIIEMLYEQEGSMLLEYERISFVLRTNTEIVKSVLNDFNLFIFKDDKFTSDSVLRRLEKKNEKSLKAKESINKRWEKKENYTNVPKSDTNVPKSDTLKESKVKDIKVKDKSIVAEATDLRKIKFKDSLKSWLEIYPQDLLNDFFRYWAEKQLSGLKMRFELQKTWDTNLRLQQWNRRDAKFNTQQQETKTLVANY